MLPNPEIFGFTINWYSFFPWLGAFFTIAFGCWYYYKKADFKLSYFQWMGFVLFLYILMMGGGRIVGIVESYMRNGYFPDISILVEGPFAGNFRWCGSLLTVLFFLPYLSKEVLNIKSFNSLFDLLVLGFCVFTIFIKQGCQFSGDGCYGVATNLPWGMYYPYGIAPNILPVHPTPIYDSLFHLIFFVLLLKWDLRHKKKVGQTSQLYFMAVPIFYIFLEIIRVNPVVAYGITLPQVVYAIVLMACIPAYNTLIRNNKAGTNVPYKPSFLNQ